MYNKKNVKPMKRSSLLLGLTIMALWSCQNQGSGFEYLTDPETPSLPLPPKEPRDEGIIEVNKNDFLLVKIVPSTVSINSTNKLVIVNNTQHELYWNTIYSLEHFDNNNWKPIAIQGDWIDIGYALYPGEIFSNGIITGGMTLFSLVKDFNNGKKGKYRLLGKLTIPDVGRYNLSAEFEVI